MTENPVIVLGGGGHARVLISELRLLNYRIEGVLDPNLGVGKTVSGGEVVGSDEQLDRYKPSEIRLIIGIGRTVRNCRRTYLLDYGVGKEFVFEKVLSKNAVIHDDVKVGEGVQVVSGAVVQAGTTIGAHSVLNTSSSLDHDCLVGSNVWISPGVTVCGGVTLEENVFLGAGVVVLPGCVVSRDSVIRAGTVVTQSRVGT